MPAGGLKVSQFHPLRAWITDLDGTLTVLDIDWEETRLAVRSLLGTNHQLRPIALSIPRATDDPSLRKKAFDFVEKVEMEAALKAPRDERLCSLVAQIKRKGLRMGLVTHQGRVPATVALERLGILSSFGTVVTREDALDRSEQIGLAARSLGVQLRSVIFTGDSAWDVEAGRRLGCLTVSVRQRNNGADAFIASVFGLLEILD